MIMRLPLPGDLMFTFHPGGVLSEAIHFITKCKISHAQMIIDQGANAALRVVSAESSGLEYKWIRPEQFGYDDWWKQSAFPSLMNGAEFPWFSILYDERLENGKRKKLVDWMVKKCDEKIPYDIWGLISFIVNIDLNTEKKSFCSEVCFQAYDENGILPPVDGVDHAFVSPRDLYIASCLRPIVGDRKEIR